MAEETSEETSSGENIPENPLLARLLVTEGATSAITLRGYIGPSRAEGYVNLYRSLNDLSECLEIARGDILYFREVPESFMLFGATIIWVKKDAQITYRQGVTVETTDLNATTNEIVGLREVNKGRLRILTRPTPLRKTCQSYCWTCQSYCLRCRSYCWYGTD